MQNKGYPTDWLFQLKQKNNIVSIIGKYIHLERKGGKYWACCPFHNEKTPSFTVSEDEGFFYCFGCKESGDVISFVQKYESCDFSQAVEILAKNAGMEVPEFKSDEQSMAKKQAKERVLKLLDFAYKHYQENLYLTQAKNAQEYIKKEIIVSSLRIDNVISTLIGTSRNEVLEKFKNKEIIYNYNEITKPTYQLNVGDTFSIRKHGKYKYNGILKNTKKGGFIVEILMYK